MLDSSGGGGSASESSGWSAYYGGGDNVQSYSLSTNFRLELIEPSAIEVEGYFFSYDAVSNLARFEPCSL